jgi:apolipoprotein N-acyltransferase
MITYKVTIVKEKQSHNPLSIISGKIALALLTSILLTLSFPDFDQSWIAWFALVPLIFACHGQGPLNAFALGLLSGIGSVFGICHWIFEVPGFHVYHALPLALYCGVFPGLWCALQPLLRVRWMSMIILGPSLWVALDYLKAHAGFMAFPWATLAQSQHSNIAVIQLAKFTGEYGVTFLVVMASVALAEAFVEKKWKGIVVAAAAIALVYTWGFITLSDTQKEDKLKVVVVQPNILLSERKTAHGRADSLDRLEYLTIAAAAAEPALVVWPETAVRDLKRDSVLFARLKTISQTINAPILTGASEFMKSSRKMDSRGNTVYMDNYQYNSAHFITPGWSPALAPYRKRILVPFGEYLPMASSFKWPSWLVPEVFNVLPGDGYKHFAIAEDRWVSPIICWENLFADYVRLLAREDTTLIVQLTNDNWFGKTAAPRQHNMASVFRAVENRIPVLIASNTGPSQIIDAFGRILSEVPHLFSEGVATAEVTLGYGKAFYTRNGDVFAFMCMALISIIIFFKVNCREKSDILFPARLRGTEHS